LKKNNWENFSIIGIPIIFLFSKSWDKKETNDWTDHLKKGDKSDEAERGKSE